MSSDILRFSSLRIGAAFRFCGDERVWVKCRGGFRPGRGGQLHACAPHQTVTRYTS